MMCVSGLIAVLNKPEILHLHNNIQILVGISSLVDAGAIVVQGWCTANVFYIVSIFTCSVIFF